MITIKYVVAQAIASEPQMAIASDLLDTEGACLEGHIVGDQNQITALGILRGLHGHLPRQHANVIAALRALGPETLIYEQKLGHPMPVGNKTASSSLLSKRKCASVGFNSPNVNSE